jgi:hypothetical protein
MAKLPRWVDASSEARRLAGNACLKNDGRKSTQPTHSSARNQPVSKPNIYKVTIYMSSLHENSNELSLLMELRLAFGPGTRLWAYRSREDLCYDWLRFKARRANASFREFALALYNQEKEQALHGANLCAIRRRVITILKAYRVKKRYRNVPAIAIAAQSNGSPRSHDDRSRKFLSLAKLPIANEVFADAKSPPLRPPLKENEVAR